MGANTEFDKGSQKGAAPFFLDFASSSVAVSRVVRVTASDRGTDSSFLTIGDLTGTITSGAPDATHIARGSNADGFIDGIEAWLNTGGNLALAGLASIVNNEDGTLDLIYPAGINADLLPDTNDPNLTITETTVGVAATGRYALPTTTPNGTQARDLDTGFTYTLVDNMLVATEAGWVISYPAGMLASVQVNLNEGTSAIQPLFTCPAGYKTVLTASPLNYRDLSATPGMDCEFNVGWGADPVNVIGDCFLQAVLDTGQSFAPDSGTGGLGPPFPLGTAGQILGFQVTGANGSALTMTVDVFAYLIKVAP